MKTKAIIFLAAFITGFGITLGASAQLKELDLFGDELKQELEAPTASLVDEVYDLDVAGLEADGLEGRVAQWAPTPYED